MSNESRKIGSREQLTSLVQRAERLLDQQRDRITDGSADALQDMLEQARQALNDNGEVPFLRNREFLFPRAEEAVCFATRRFTMVPPFTEKNAVYTMYGLEPALEWFEHRSQLGETEEGLAEKAVLALEKAQELLHFARCGEGVGEYDVSAKDALKQSQQMLEAELASFRQSSDRANIARSTSAVFNRMREFRHSRRLLTDIDPDASLYLSGAELAELQQAVRTEPMLRQRYEQIEQLGCIHSLNDLKQASELVMQGTDAYEELNDQFYLWSSTDKIVNFKAPHGAETATLSFILPAQENEAEGLGHVWIDDLNILSSSGGSLQIVNGGFEEGVLQPLGWKPEVRKGCPILRTEEVYPFCGGGDRTPESLNPSSQAARRSSEVAPRSLYICNPGPDDEGSWTYDGELAVEGGIDYTLTFLAKLDGKLKHGIRVLISFKDGIGNSTGEFDYYFNRKSSIPGGKFQLGMQCDAICYAMTGKREYAEKTKLAILYILNDFCQGAEHWMVTNLRPEGSDSYGAVQGGRLLCAVAVSCSLIRTADVFSEEERKHFYAMAEYLLRYVLDLRDRTEWTPEEAQCGCSNWQTDMCAGAGYLMMALPDFPSRHIWLNNANAVLLAQLRLKVNPDGSWPESIRYHHAALERFAGYAKVLKKVTGENWFESTPLGDMFHYAIEMQTPGYEYFGGRIGTPPFGDHALGSGEEFGYFPVFIPEIAEQNPILADRMHAAWVAAGTPVKKPWGESIMLENLLVPATQTACSSPFQLNSTAEFPDSGIYIFRQNSDEQTSFFAMMSSPQPIAHGHLDQGSFILYAGSVPLVMDSGIEGYFDSSTSWHICSYSHACVQFAAKQTFVPAARSEPINLSAGTFSVERGWLDVPRTSRVLEVRLEEKWESIRIEIANPEEGGRHIRSVVHVKEPDLYLIRDEIKEYDGKVLFSLPIAALQTRVDGSFIQADCSFGMALDTLFLSRTDSIVIENGRSTPFFPGDDPQVSYMQYVRAVSDAGNGFLTVLSPRREEDMKLEAVREADGSVWLRTAYGTVRLELAELEGSGNSAEALALHDAISIGNNRT